MAKKDFEEMGIENFVVYRSNLVRDWPEKSEGCKYIAGNTYYIVARVFKSNTMRCSLIDSVGKCTEFSSVAGHTLNWWKHELRNRCKIVYKGKDFIDSWNFVQQQPDAERFV